MRGIDADNGSEVINEHPARYCQSQETFTRGRPCKKDDNAHAEQKTWPHVRKLVGDHRDDPPAAVAALDALSTGKLRLPQNLFPPSVKLVRTERAGARVRRRDHAALERVQACPEADPTAGAALVRLRDGWIRLRSRRPSTDGSSGSSSSRPGRAAPLLPLSRPAGRPSAPHAHPPR